MPTAHRTHLNTLKDESIHIIREVAAEFERPCCCSAAAGLDRDAPPRGGRLARPRPFPVMHVDTGHNFPEVSTTAIAGWRARRRARRRLGAGVDRRRPGRRGEGRRPAATACRPWAARRDRATRSTPCRRGRRDEEKARAKERVDCFRDEFGQWDPKNQRPELWSLYNGAPSQG